MSNRIALMPLYTDYYKIATRVIDELIAAHSGDENAAYAELFTCDVAAQAPPTTPLALTRQTVSNEFVAVQMALGGFRGPLDFRAKSAATLFVNCWAKSSGTPVRC